MNDPKEPNHLVLDDWITSREAAERIGVSLNQVRHLARQGTIKAQKFGHSWMLFRESVDAYAAEERHPGPKPRELNSPK